MLDEVQELAEYRTLLRRLRFIFILFVVLFAALYLYVAFGECSLVVREGIGLPEYHPQILQIIIYIVLSILTATLSAGLVVLVAAAKSLSKKRLWERGECNTVLYISPDVALLDATISFVFGMIRFVICYFLSPIYLLYVWQRIRKLSQKYNSGKF